MQKQLSLVEMATYGYASDRVKEGSWLARTFGNRNKEVNNDECIERSDSDQNKQTGR